MKLTNVGLLVLACVSTSSLVLDAHPARAGDGSREINQTCVATGCFPGDLPGFPVTISTPGSYVLTSNLEVPDVNTTAIDFPGASRSENHADIDLNGFSILGPVVCGGPIGFFSCNSSGTGDGIATTTGGWRVSLHDGEIIGMGDKGVDTNASLHMWNVGIESNGGGGVAANDSVAIRDSRIAVNGGDGISLGFGGRVRASTITANERGIVCRQCLIEHNLIALCRSDCIRVQFDTAAILGNVIEGFAGIGINATGSSTVSYSQNNIDPTIYGGTTVTDVASGAIQTGSNVCDGDTTCP